MLHKKVMQQTNIALVLKRIEFLSENRRDILVDPMLGAVALHSCTFEGGPFIGDDDIGETEFRVDVLLKGFDSGVGSDVLTGMKIG